MPVSAANSSISASPGTVLANGTSVTTITVTVANEDGQPLADVPVSCYGSGSAFVSGGGATDAGGSAVFSGRNTVAETVEFFADVGEPPDVIANADRSSIVASPTSLPADGVAEVTITMTLLNAAGEPLEGVVCDCQSTNAYVGQSGDAATTNANGVAVFPSDGVTFAAHYLGHTGVVQYYTSACPGLFSNDVTLTEPPP